MREEEEKSKRAKWRGKEWKERGKKKRRRKRRGRIGGILSLTERKQGRGRKKEERMTMRKEKEAEDRRETGSYFVHSIILSHPLSYLSQHAKREKQKGGMERKENEEGEKGEKRRGQNEKRHLTRMRDLLGAEIRRRRTSR